jgi:hypothetical protein
VSCIQKDPKAVQIDSCQMKCQDEQCAMSCEQQAGCQDESCAAIGTLDQCAQQCGLDMSGGPTDGSGGPGGPSGSGSQFPGNGF